MRYTEIFDEAVDVLKKDSSTCKDIGAGDPDKYRRMISDDMDELEFTKIVKKYIATIGVPAHLGFANNNMTGLDFAVKRYGEALYVSNASDGSNFRKNDRIIAIDGRTIDEAAERDAEFLMGETDERQGFLWRNILLFSSDATIVRDGKEITLPIRSQGYSSGEEKYYMKDLGDNNLLLRLADFGDEDAIRQIYAQNENALMTCENLIIDVRGNGGGSDTAFLPLLEFCYPEGEKADDYFADMAGVETNYSERNCESRVGMMKQFLEEDVPDEVRNVIDAMIAETEENRGRGFVTNPTDSESGIVGKANPKRIIVITDEECGSSGDAFVEDVAFSPKVTVVGRPTLGITDYSNCTSAVFDQFELIYPTSRDKRIDEGKGLLHKGVPVDIYIPWTPENLKRDVELEYVLGMIAGHMPETK